MKTVVMCLFLMAFFGCKTTNSQLQPSGSGLASAVEGADELKIHLQIDCKNKTDIFRPDAPNSGYKGFVPELSFDYMKDGIHHEHSIRIDLTKFYPIKEGNQIYLINKNANKKVLLGTLENGWEKKIKNTCIPIMYAYKLVDIDIDPQTTIKISDTYLDKDSPQCDAVVYSENRTDLFSNFVYKRRAVQLLAEVSDGTNVAELQRFYLISFKVSEDCFTSCRAKRLYYQMKSDTVCEQSEQPPVIGREEDTSWGGWVDELKDDEKFNP